MAMSSSSSGSDTELKNTSIFNYLVYDLTLIFSCTESVNEYQSKCFKVYRTDKFWLDTIFADNYIFPALHEEFPQNYVNVN